MTTRMLLLTITSKVLNPHFPSHSTLLGVFSVHLPPTFRAHFFTFHAPRAMGADTESTSRTRSREGKPFSLLSSLFHYYRPSNGRECALSAHSGPGEGPTFFISKEWQWCAPLISGPFSHSKPPRTFSAPLIAVEAHLAPLLAHIQLLTFHDRSLTLSGGARAFQGWQ
jgi:hypothetical protein